MAELKTIKQCKGCPWKVSVDPPRDVPKYAEGIYDRMRASTRSGIESLSNRPYAAMACHNQRDGEQRPCAGWLHNQLGVGNNLGVRMRVAAGKLPVPKVVGEQHETPPHEET